MSMMQKTEIYGKKEEQSRKRSRKEGKEGIPSGGGKVADDQRGLCICDSRG